MTWIDEQPAEKVLAALEKYRADDSLTMRQIRDLVRGNEHFGLWLAVVNARMVRKVGVGILDIADWTWFDAFSDGMRPRDAVDEALADDDTFSMMGGE